MFFLLGIVLPWEFFRNTQRKHYLKAYWLLPVTVLSMWTALGLVLLLVSCCLQTWKLCIIIGRLQLQVLSVETLKLNNVVHQCYCPFSDCYLHLSVMFLCILVQIHAQRLSQCCGGLIWKQISGRKHYLFNFIWEFGHLCNYIAWNKVLVHVIKTLHTTSVSNVR